MKKIIFLLWLQGWDNAPWLQREVLSSWKINNPEWNIELIDQKNLKNYVSDIDYIYDKSKNISPQAKSDIIRLSLLKNFGGVWADSTLLCMQPLKNWVFEAIKPSGIWMYHGHGAGLNSGLGPASWFIISEKYGYVITKWKKACDSFWQNNYEAKEYFWMDILFKNLLKDDPIFKEQWINTPFLYCEKEGSSHTLASYNYKMEENTRFIKDIFKIKPPYVLKLSNQIEKKLPNISSKRFKSSNAYYAIQMSKRGYFYKHIFEPKEFIANPVKEKPYFLKLLKKIIKRVLQIK